MSGLIDLSGIASRAYTPAAKSLQNSPLKPETPAGNNSARSAVVDRRLAPAFSIELSLAAQNLLGGAEPARGASYTPAAPAVVANSPTANSQIDQGVGRREAPLVSDQRDVALGRQIDIQI